MARRADLIEVAPDVEPEHVCRIEARTAGRGGDRAGEAEVGQVEARDECVDDPHESLGGDVVVDAGRQKTDLTSVEPADVTHPEPPLMRVQADSGRFADADQQQNERLRPGQPSPTAG